MTTTVEVSRNNSSSLEISASVLPSNELVASSKTRKFGCVNIALAIPKRCLWPPLIFVPFSPTGESIPSGRFCTKSSKHAIFKARSTSSSVASAVGYNTPQEEGVFIQSFKVAPDGGFNAVTVQKGKALGTVTEAGISGTFVNSSGGSGSFRGDRKSESGLHSKSAGYYVGTYDGASEGSSYAILAADGSLFFYSIDDPTSPSADGDGGGFGTVDAANVLSGATVPNGLKLTGTLNTATSVLTGSYGLGDITLGTFRLARTLTPQ